MSKENRVKFSFDARYFTDGDSEADHIWLCLHGYAQLAPYFIRKFNVIAEQAQVVVPEGLHRFYMQDGSGRVVASWMTKEDRETDIKNYLEYLDTVMSDILTSRKTKPQKIILFGFSQGVATACRYFAHSALEITDVILWAGALPPDLDLTAMRSKRKTACFHLIYGDEDPYMKDSPYKTSMEVLDDLGYSYDLETFSGVHEITATELRSLQGRMAS